MRIRGVTLTEEQTRGYTRTLAEHGNLEEFLNGLPGQRERSQAGASPADTKRALTRAATRDHERAIGIFSHSLDRAPSPDDAAGGKDHPHVIDHDATHVRIRHRAGGRDLVHAVRYTMDGDRATLLHDDPSTREITDPAERLSREVGGMGRPPVAPEEYQGLSRQQLNEMRLAGLEPSPLTETIGRIPSMDSPPRTDEAAVRHAIAEAFPGPHAGRAGIELLDIQEGYAVIALQDAAGAKVELVAPYTMRGDQAVVDFDEADIVNARRAA